jgi:hypothetical protein
MTDPILLTQLFYVVAWIRTSVAQELRLKTENSAANNSKRFELFDSLYDARLMLSAPLFF